MQQKMNENNQDLVSCEICLKSIPTRDCKCVETDEYVANFCGLECYEEWVKKAEETKKENSNQS